PHLRGVRPDGRRGARGRGARPAFVRSRGRPADSRGRYGRPPKSACSPPVVLPRASLLGGLSPREARPASPCARETPKEAGGTRNQPNPGAMLVALPAVARWGSAPYDG